MGVFSYVGLGVLLGKGMSAVEQAVTESCEDLVGRAQDLTPVDTGTLRASIHVESVERSGFTVTGTVATGGEADYAAYVEFGTVNMGAQPYMTPALLENQAVYREAMARAAQGAF
ncbi:MAG TPA: HK97-gp10 family putative phage morphogenesis protein [Amycolatopsis sp.]|jgi:HK97 gp10 family phage protein|nr:HK97-gp10 family putative phage morphogenesis protein [Amycolatopsis sp.]